MNEATLISDSDIKSKYDYDIRLYTLKAIKNVRRWGSIRMPEDVLVKILFYALKGIDCKQNHFDPFQRDSIYKYLKRKNISHDPYLKQFMEDCEKECFHIMD